ncbi:MAG: PilZ domain-containing protein [Bryobacteraceae bacterium]|jgi:hypothetical protein
MDFSELPVDNITMKEKRLQGRCLCAQMVQVSWAEGKQAGAALHIVQAVLEDISELGGCVEVEEPIPLGAPLTLSIGDSEFLGHVCYCVFRDYGYFVGIRFLDDSVWSRDQVVPQHLIDLKNLARHAG